MSGLNSSKVKTQARKPSVESLDPGTYPARVVQIIDLGIQPQRPYKGEEKAPKHEVSVTYELLDEFMKDDEGNDDTTKPRWVFETFPFSSIEADLAKSTKRYMALDPTKKLGGDWQYLIGAPCMLTIVHGENKKFPEFPYENVANLAAMRPKEAEKAPALVNPTKFFTIDSGDKDLFLTLPEWVQEKIKSGLEFKGSALDIALGGEEVETKQETAVENEEDW